MAAPHVAGLLLLGWRGEFDYFVNGDPDDIYDSSDPWGWGYRIDGYAYPNSGFKDPIAKFDASEHNLTDYVKWFEDKEAPFFYEGNEPGITASTPQPDYPFYGEN